MFCHSASATSKAASSRGGGGLVTAEHVLKAAAAVGRQRLWLWLGPSRPPRKLPTGSPSRAASHSLFRFLPVCQCWLTLTPPPITTKLRNTQTSTGITANQLLGKPKRCVLFYPSVHSIRGIIPRWPLIGLTTKQQNAAHSFLFWPSLGSTKYCCNVRTIFSAAMQHWPNESMARGEPTKVT